MEFGRIVRCWLLAVAFICVTAQAPAATNFEQETSANKGVKLYTQPGVVSYKAGRFIGNDNLFDLSPNVRVVVDIVKPKGVTVGLSGDTIRGTVEAKFKKAGLKPAAPSKSAEAALPFMHINLIVVPISGGYAVSANARLFESISVPRVEQEAGAIWQGITWEKQTLIVAPEAELAGLVDSTLDGMLNNFLKRYAFYEKLKKYMKK